MGRDLLLRPGSRRQRHYGGGHQRCAPETCADGSQVTIQRNCGVYANARPFTTTSGLDFLRTRPAGYQVFWRYVSRDNGYVMVRDPNVGTGQGNWAFVQRRCLPALSGSAVA